MEQSDFLGHIACPACGSSDANSLYSDGHTHCFNCQHRTFSTEKSTIPFTRGPRMTDMLHGDFVELPKRGLTEATCRKYGYMVGKDRAGKGVQIANYHDENGAVTSQKLRYADKTFACIGDHKNAALFGQNLWKGTGRRIVVTEGEIDAMSVAQAFGLTWDVVSIPNGAQSAKKALQRSLEFLEGYDQIVLWFDNDEPGREAVSECADLFTPGKCAVAVTGLKDANEVLQKEGAKAVTVAVYNARVYRPDGIVTLEEISERVLATAEIGRSWPWSKLTAATFGRRLGEVYGFGAGTGVGKTDLFTQCIAHDVMTLKVTVGVIYMEQGVAETGKRTAGKIAGKRFHVPDGSWTQDELVSAWGALKDTGRLFLYDNFGAMDWTTIKAKIRYMVQSLGCEHIYLDHMTALAAAEDDERKALEKIMSEAASLAKALNFTLHYVSHLATPEGKPHEEGGRVMIRHFKGSRALGFWSHGMYGLERDQQAADPVMQNLTILRCLKDRFTGNATGKIFPMTYNAVTGILEESELPPPERTAMNTPEDDLPF